MICVIATIDLAAGGREEFLAEFRALVPKVLAENGCLEYGPAIDVITEISSQDPIRDDSVVVLEKWQDLASLKAHLAAAHMLEYRPRVRHLVVRTRLQVLEPA